MSSSEVTLEFDLRVIRLSAIKKAALRFAGCYSADIRLIGSEQANVVLTSQTDQPVDSLSFRNETLDQDLREIVAEETMPVRNLLLAQAFAELSVVDPLGDSADFHNDPLGIAAELHGKLPTEGEA